MPQQDRGNSKPQNQMLFIFECVMSVFYLGFACVFLFTGYFNETVSGIVRLLVGILLGIYGIFRIYRALKKISEKEKE